MGAVPALPLFAEIGFRGGRGVSIALIRRVRPRRHRPMGFPPKAGDGLTRRTGLKKACDYVKLDIHCCFTNTEDKPLIWLHGEIRHRPALAG